MQWYLAISISKMKKNMLPKAEGEREREREERQREKEREKERPWGYWGVEKSPTSLLTLF